MGRTRSLSHSLNHIFSSSHRPSSQQAALISSRPMARTVASLFVAGLLGAAATTPCTLDRESVGSSVMSWINQDQPLHKMLYSLPRVL